MKNADVLVTGATGFIGSHLVRLLTETGEKKVVASNTSGSARNLEDLRDRIEVVRADIGTFSNVMRLIETHRPKTIYHIGAMLAPACDADPEAGIRVNALGTYYMLEAARLFGVQQLIFAGSMSVFTSQYSNDPVLEDYSLTRPETIYGTAKLFSENIGLFYRRQYGFDYRGLRLPNGQRPGNYDPRLSGVLQQNNRGERQGQAVHGLRRSPHSHPGHARAGCGSCVC